MKAKEKEKQKMAKRWTVAETIVLAQEYRAVIEKNDLSPEGKDIIEKWEDMSSRHARCASLFYALSAYPEANVFRYFNTSMSVRKVESAMKEGVDFSTLAADEDDEETEADETKAVKKRGPKAKRDEAVQRPLLDEDKDSDIMGLLNLKQV